MKRPQTLKNTNTKEYAYILKRVLGFKAALKHTKKQINYHLNKKFTEKRQFSLDYWKTIKKELTK